MARPLNIFSSSLEGSLGIGNCRIVDEHDNGLAFHINSLVVVPAVLWRYDPISDKDKVRILDFHLGNVTPADCHIVGLWLETERLTCLRQKKPQTLE